MDKKIKTEGTSPLFLTKRCLQKSAADSLNSAEAKDKDKHLRSCFSGADESKLGHFLCNVNHLASSYLRARRSFAEEFEKQDRYRLRPVLKALSSADNYIYIAP